MGSMVKDATKRSIENGLTAEFELMAWLDELGTDDGAYACSVAIRDASGKMVELYVRDFPIKSYHERHYKAFINKFVRDPDYRQQFRDEQFANDPEYRKFYTGEP